jgi:hypothetical protein
MNQKLYSNSTIRIEAQVKLRDGTLTDPTGIRFLITDPADITTTYVYGTNVQLKRDVGITGIYYVEWLALLPGKYRYTWESYGDISIAQKGMFEVEDSRW